MSKFQRMFVLISGTLFILSMSSGLFAMFTKSPEPSQTEIAQEQLSQNETLERAALGYEKVLMKEPQNKFALDNLIKTRLEMNDLDGLQAQAERLQKAHPQEKIFSDLIKAIDQERQAQADNQKENP